MTDGKLVLSWGDVAHDVALLRDKITSSCVTYDWVIGIAVGGLIPLALIAKELQTKKVTTVSASSYNEASERGELTIHAMPHSNLHNAHILLVDEIADSGETLQSIKRTLMEECGAASVTTATLCVRTDHCAANPDFFAREVTQWVMFPWDQK
ncbi:MAG: hypothetical protein RI911_144 [Candidatus Parcubacteria bacterium]|jgi:hypoxanthine phosphoribosyltransferase